MKTYEGMFLLEAGQPSFDEAVQPVRAILDRNGAEVLHMKKWDERRLAYEIEGRRRGLYVLTYFKAPPEKIAEVEHDVKLSEKVLRVLILSADHVTAERMAEPTPAESEPARREREDEGEEGRERPRSRRPAREPEAVEAKDADESDAEETPDAEETDEADK